MKLKPLIILLVLALPILEIATFIAVGREIGILWTLALLLVAGIAGTAVIRLQGVQLIRRLQADVNAGRVPAESLVQGALLALAGFFLLLPGLLTDVLAFILLMPPLRKLAAAWLRRNMTVVETAAGFRATAGSRGPSGVVDLDPDEFEVKDRDPDAPPSPWSEGREPPRLP
ncbi:FxsA family protein [Chthonobacter albigriseus]|uniref:FxsA family protein n=1 Tax=Chthonobacter albigriseus TaxID=1683161 RepID=UPI0015EED24D|nr:FxsA family protein [Chthonobacter albigriseus]